MHELIETEIACTKPGQAYPIPNASIRCEWEPPSDHLLWTCWHLLASDRESVHSKSEPPGKMTPLQQNTTESRIFEQHKLVPKGF